VAQYGIFVYSPAPGDPADLTAEAINQLEQYGGVVEQLGGQVLTGFAFEPSTSAKTVRGSKVTGGPASNGTVVVSGFFVLEAPDLDVAVEIAKRNPAAGDGAVEVRPLFAPPAQ
jgi:hypothetical protein